MSKQIYIDSEGNEIQVSGTVNSADMMPMSASDSTKVSEAIMRSNPVDQTAGQSITLAVPVVFGYYYADQWYAYVPLPFVTKNTDYSITLSVVNADNQGDITNKISITSKAKTYFRILTTKTMPSFPNMYSNNLGICTFTITFA